MARTFTCPRCGGLLNPGTKVIFVIERGAERSLILLSPEFGDYATVLGHSLPLEKGQAYTFICPICRADLSSPANSGFVEILAREDDGSQERVDFSRVAGEHATFVRGPGGVQRYGEEATKYDGANFFGVGRNENTA
jgi:hypothetical protein